MDTVDRRLAAIARRQRMLITLPDVLGCGGHDHHVRARLAAGRWEQVERGVYLIAGAPFDWPTRLLATLRAAGPGAAGSHFAAGRVLGHQGCESAGLEISVPRGQRFRRAGVRVHESSDLDRCRILVRDGIEVTDHDRTILDIGRYVGHRRLGRVVEDARRREVVTWSSLIGMHTAHARQGRHGIRRLRAVIAADVDRAEVTDTDVEMLLLGILRSSDLPEPSIGHRVHDTDGRFVAQVDLAFPRYRIAIECDGDIHLRADVHERDLARQNDLVLRGWVVLRFSNDRILRRPEAVVAEIRDAVAAARRRVLAPPA